MVQLTSDSFPSGSFSLHHHEWIFFFSGKHNLTLIKILNITEVFQKQIWWRSHGTEKNHLRNMVKENDTWQFTNWPFQISKRPTRAQPHSSSSHEYSDWQLVWDRSAGTAPPTSFSCFCYRLKNFLALEIHLLWGKKNIYLHHLSLSFHQISCRRSAGGRACAGGEVIKLWVWANVQHSQTILMPRVVICQNELWSRILLITLPGKKKSLLSRVSACFSQSLCHLLFSCD